MKNIVTPEILMSSKKRKKEKWNLKSIKSRFCVRNIICSLFAVAAVNSEMMMLQDLIVRMLTANYESACSGSKLFVLYTYLPQQ